MVYSKHYTPQKMLSFQALEATVENYLCLLNDNIFLSDEAKEDLLRIHLWQLHIGISNLTCWSLGGGSLAVDVVTGA